MKQVVVRSVRPRLVSLALGASVAAIAAGTAGSAAAQCAPDPTVANGTTTCQGTDADGLVVATNSRVVVAAGARVGPLVLTRSSTGSSTIASLDNSGTVASRTGAAVAGTARDTGFVGLSALTNQPGAVIAGANGGVAVTVGRLTNAGRIDGGAGSAYAVPGSSSSVIFPSSVTNSGSLLSDSAAATLFFSFGSPGISNSGRIENLGSGAAIESPRETIGVANAATGVIASAGPVAVRSGFQLSMNNAGTIIGSVEGGSGFNDYIDNRAGTILGDVRLNGGDDHLIARAGDARLVDGISGAIDGGAGTDVLELIVGRDRTVSGIERPAGFEVV